MDCRVHVCSTVDLHGTTYLADNLATSYMEISAPNPGAPPFPPSALTSRFAGLLLSHIFSLLCPSQHFYCVFNMLSERCCQHCWRVQLCPVVDLFWSHPELALSDMGLTRTVLKKAPPVMLALAYQNLAMKMQFISIYGSYFYFLPL